MTSLFICQAALLFASPLGSLSAAESRSNPAQIRVILWFDTEDYLSPNDDDATKRLCELLTERGIRATFKIVGEKARVLERRNRSDVIAALKKHDIGYHANFHSVHPTPTEYLAECGWLDGIAEFVRREGEGAADVRRIFGLPTLACYGQPGSSWAPQTLGGLKQIGIAPSGVPCYVDEGSHVGLDEKPFWYAGVLNVYHLGENVTRMDLHDPKGLDPAEKRVSAIADRLRAQGGGLISIYYHPCEWIHKQFWDSVNFARGQNPPREEWKVPPQRSPQETEAAFKQFTQYIDHIRAIPAIKWVTASDLPALYPDLSRSEGATRDELDELARRMKSGLNYQRIGDHVYSPADQFELLTRAWNDALTGKLLHEPLKPQGLLGPDAPPRESNDVSNISMPAFRDAVRDTEKFIRAEHRVPAQVFIGSDTVPPSAFMRTMAALWIDHDSAHELTTRKRVVIAAPAPILTERQIAEDTPDLFGGWIIHKEGFRAPKVMQLARLQAWTLKPATPLFERVDR